jgi:hypothetical protein
MRPRMVAVTDGRVAVGSAAGLIAKSDELRQSARKAPRARFHRHQISRSRVSVQPTQGGFERSSVTPSWSLNVFRECVDVDVQLAVTEARQMAESRLSVGEVVEGRR